ncbi:MAG: glycosyltransferase family 2 protein [Pirellulales bacterium]
MKRPALSIVIPAYNEQQNIEPCLQDLIDVLVVREGIETELVVVNDNSSDDTEQVVLKMAEKHPQIRLVRREPPGGFGRALRSGLEFVQGETVIMYMADRSDDPEDALLYYRKIQEGYDCVFGSRFIAGARVHRYPKLKLFYNRLVNIAIQWMFWTEHNDLTNAFKAYRREVVQSCGPYRACHFNITLEMSLSALISGYKIAAVPIRWEGRTWGSSNLRLREMGRRYLCTLLMLFFQRVLMSDDVVAERKRQVTGGQQVFPNSIDVSPATVSPSSPDDASDAGTQN